MPKYKELLIIKIRHMESHNLDEYIDKTVLFLDALKKNPESKIIPLAKDFKLPYASYILQALNALHYIKIYGMGSSYTHELTTPIQPIIARNILNEAFKFYRDASKRSIVKRAEKIIQFSDVNSNDNEDEGDKYSLILHNIHVLQEDYNSLIERIELLEGSTNYVIDDVKEIKDCTIYKRAFRFLKLKYLLSNFVLSLKKPALYIIVLTTIFLIGTQFKSIVQFIQSLLNN